MQEAIVNQITESVKQEISNFSDLGKVEQAIFRKLQDIGNNVLQNIVNEGDKGGASSIPYDHQHGLGTEQLTPGLVNWCCLLSVDDSFQLSSRKLKSLLGQRVSDKTIERVVHQVGNDGRRHEPNG